jgi:hypothetical protein
MADHRKEQRRFPWEWRLKDEEDRLHMQEEEQLHKELHDAKRKRKGERNAEANAMKEHGDMIEKWPC